ncbi:unnamed protein product [Closterium sp. Yama58-4]|nr:unnamed protein product [Closterium sp. Yama58-4]
MVRLSLSQHMAPAEYTRLIEAGVAPTPRQLQKSVEHLVPERHTRADWQRASAKNALLAARGLSSINQLSFLDKACILTVLRDHHDSSNFHQHADEFRSIVALGHRAINYRVTSLLDLVSARPPVHNYRTYLMHFALSEGWVIQHVMKPPNSPYSQCRRSARSNAGMRNTLDDMVYYGQGAQSPRPNSQNVQVAPHSGGQAQGGHAHSDSGYLQWADRVDVEDLEEDDAEDTWMLEEEEVDEDAEAAQRTQRSLSEVVAASTPATSEEQPPGARGRTMPSESRRGQVSVRNAPDDPVDAAMAARVAEQERRIAELHETIARLEGARRAVARGAEARSAPVRARERDGAVETPATTRQRTVTGRQDTRTGTHRDEPLAPMVEAALNREVRQANTGGMATAGMQNWAERLQVVHKFFPGMDDGWKVVVVDAIKIMVYDTEVGELNFWVPTPLVEKILARALKLTKASQRALLHMVLQHDEKRSGWITRQLQIWRNTTWEQGRAYTNTLHGLPYRAGSNPRVTIPARPSAQEVPRITCKKFDENYPAGEEGPGTFELRPWHRNAAGVPFATENFERGLYASYRRPIPPPLVLHTYLVAFWLFGVEVPILTGAPLVTSAPQNEEGVRWYHERVKRWMRAVILRRTAEHGPFWDADKRGWRFRRDSVVVISEDGMEDMSPTLPANTAPAIPAVTPSAANP